MTTVSTAAREAAEAAAVIRPDNVHVAIDLALDAAHDPELGLDRSVSLRAAIRSLRDGATAAALADEPATAAALSLAAEHLITDFGIAA